MRTRVLATILVLLGVLFMDRHVTEPAGGKEPVASGASLDANTSAVVDGNNQFATDLYGRLKDKTSGNLFFSPYSISTALAMTYAGAAGETQKQMAEVLHFTVPESELHEAMARLRKSLLADKERATSFGWPTASGGSKGYEFLPEFLQTTRQVLRSRVGSRGLRQGHAKPPARRSTRGSRSRRKRRSRTCWPPACSIPMTRLVLTNAIYFKGNWQEKFEKDATKDAPFHVSADKEVTVPMMHQTEQFGYRAVDDLQVLEMPYAKGELSMIVLLPKEIEGPAPVGEEADPGEPPGVDQGAAAAEGDRLRAAVQDDLAVRPEGHAPGDGDDVGLRRPRRPISPA